MKYRIVAVVVATIVAVFWYATTDTNSRPNIPTNNAAKSLRIP